MNKVRKNLRLITLMLFIAAVVSGWVVYKASVDDNFSLHVLNVGQGDAIFLRTPEDVRILIDGGPGDKILSELGKVLPFYDRRLDLVILTHPDADHLEGLVPVLANYRVGAFLWTETKKDTPAFLAMTDVLKKKNIKTEKVLAGDKIKTSDGLAAYVLWPPANAEIEKTNETSVVSQVKFQGYSFLLTGDIGEISEHKMVEIIKPEYLKSSILKVGHHGSRFSSSQIFLNAVRPKVSVISSGKGNLYGHPTVEVLQRLGDSGSRILRTDLDGIISFILTKKGLVVRSQK